MYTVETLAQHLNVSGQCVRNWIKSGMLECVHETGTCTIISEESLDNFLKSNPQYIKNDSHWMYGEWYTVKQFAKKYGFKRNTVYDWIDKGKLKTTKTSCDGRMYIITKDEAERFLNKLNDVEEPEVIDVPCKQPESHHLYAVSEFANIIGVPVKRAYNIVEKGQIKVIKGEGKLGRIRIDPSEVEKYLQQRKTGHNAVGKGSDSKDITTEIDDRIAACEMVVDCLKAIRNKL